MQLQAFFLRPILHHASMVRCGAVYGPAKPDDTAGRFMRKERFEMPGKLQSTRAL